MTESLNGIQNEYSNRNYVINYADADDNYSVIYDRSSAINSPVLPQESQADNNVPHIGEINTNSTILENVRQYRRLNTLICEVNEECLFWPTDK